MAKRRQTMIGRMATIVLLVSLALPAATFGQSGSGSADRQADGDHWSALVGELGSPQFRVRQKAFDALLEGGAEAVPAVVDGLLSHDAETRARSLTILERLAESRDPSSTGVARTVIEDRMASGREHDVRRLAAVEARLREAWTRHAIEQIIRLGGTVQRTGFNGTVPGYQVHLARGWTGGEQRLEVLLDLEPVVSLSLEHSSIGDSGLPLVARLTNLRRLYLGDCQMSGKQLELLKPLAHLEYLSLKQLPIDDDDLASLPAFPQLSALGLDNTAVTDSGLKQLKKYPDLQVLWLDQTKITDAGLRELGQLNSLRILYLQGMQSPGEGLESLAGLANLRYVSLKGAKLTPETTKHVAKLKQLETLGLDHTEITDEQLAPLAEMPSLKTLWLSKTAITDEGAKHLAKIPSLETIYLHGSKVTSEGADALRSSKPLLQVLR